MFDILKSILCYQKPIKNRNTKLLCVLVGPLVEWPRVARERPPQTGKKKNSKCKDLYYVIM